MRKGETNNFIVKFGVSPTLPLCVQLFKFRVAKHKPCVLVCLKNTNGFGTELVCNVSAKLFYNTAIKTQVIEDTASQLTFNFNYLTKIK